MNAKLLVVLGKTTKREVALQLPAVLGRSRDADVTVAHPLISRRHCEISENNGLLMLQDLASLNGTMIGGRRVVTAPLLPDAEFTIGPLTFRVHYEFNGALESIPEARFVDGGDSESTGAAQVSAGEEGLPNVEGALPFESAAESLSGDLAMPDLMALADADPDEALPPLAAPPKPVRRTAPAGPPWAPVARDNQPTVPMPPRYDEPVEVDSSLQSGGHVKESPWAAEVQAADAPQPSEQPPAPNPPRKPSFSDENDPEFGSFLEGLE